MLSGLECDIIVEYRERLTELGYEIVENALRCERGAENRIRHAIEDMNHRINEEARLEHEHEADEAEKEDVEET